MLKRYPWPGNVRELENLVRRLAALYPQDVITLAVIEAELTQPAVTQDMDDGGCSGQSVDRGGAQSGTLFCRFQDGLPPPGLYHRVLREVEYPLLTAALTATRGNQIKAADLLGRESQYACARRSATWIFRSSAPPADTAAAE